MKKIIALMLALIMVLAMTACNNIEPSDDGSDAKMINVAIEIDYPDDAEKKDVEANLTVEEGTSAIDMLYSYADANNMEVVLDENSPTIYVISIDGVEQSNDAGWVYEIDDEMTMDAADEIILEEGMKITWEYMSWGEF
jgi:uncharacterized lipoprotein YehR (DUF1307 family)